MSSLSSSSKLAGECEGVRSGRRKKSCTSLLHDPASVLRDRKRWPDHLCYPVMVESCRQWAAENDPEHAGEYPLPLPDGRRALLALRVRRRRSTLDLFGLAGYKPEPVPEVLPPGIRYEQIGHNPALENPDAYSWGDEMACVLKEYDEDASLSEVAFSAQEWWRRICNMIPLGRPRGSGTYASRDEFIAALTVAVREVRAAGLRVTQPAVEQVLGVHQGHGRQLRKWLDQHKVSWSEAKKL